MVALQIRRGVGDQRERRGVGLGKAIERERGNVEDDLIFGFAREALATHAFAQPLFDLGHPLRRTFEAHRAAELFRFTAGEARCDHRDPKQLLLEQRDAQGSFQDRLEGGVGILDRFPTGASVEIGMDHLSDDRAGADDCDLDHQVVEGLRLESRERCHLGAALDLEHADRVCLAHHRVGLRVVGGGDARGRSRRPRASGSGESSLRGRRACRAPAGRS